MDRSTMQEAQSALDPQGPSQPPLNDVYKTSGNPADKEPAEKREAQANASQNSGSTVDKRVPSQQSSSTEEATESSLHRGVRGAPAGEEAKGETEESMGRHNELDGQQMRASGEGQVADTVDKKPGASGAQESFTNDLDRKKAEQAPAREAIKEQRAQNVDVGGILGQRGGPANPVDKDNYPNSDKQ